MTTIEVHPEPVLDDPTGGAHHVTHWMCCLEKRGPVAFCGTALCGDELPEDELPNCVVCDEFALGPNAARCPYDGLLCPPEEP